MTLYERIMKLIENSEDLSDLPNIARDVQGLETSLQEHEDKIAKLYETNRKYLAMIPVDEPPAKKEEPKQPTPAEAVQEILEKWKG